MPAEIRTEHLSNIFVATYPFRTVTSNPVTNMANKLSIGIMVNISYHCYRISILAPVSLPSQMFIRLSRCYYRLLKNWNTQTWGGLCEIQSESVMRLSALYMWTSGKREETMLFLYAFVALCKDCITSVNQWISSGNYVNAVPPLQKCSQLIAWSGMLPFLTQSQ